MKKQHISLLNFITVLFIISCGPVKEKSSYSAAVIDYKVLERKIFDDSLMTKLHKMEPGIEKQTALKNMEAMMNPNPSYYRLTVGEKMSKLSYLPPLEIHENSSFTSHSTPFTKENTYRFIDSLGAYTDFSSRIPNTYMKVEDHNLSWEDGKKDTVFSGIRSHLFLGSKPHMEVKAWVTDEFPNNLGIYDIMSPNGFVIAYEITKYNQAPFKTESIIVYPRKITTKKISHDPLPEFQKAMTMQEIRKYFQKQNQERQQ